MGETAIHAGADTILPTYRKMAEQPVIKEAEGRKEKFARLADHEGWKEMELVINQFIEELKNIKVNPQTDTPESVGFRYLAADIAAGYLQEIINTPIRAKKLLSKKNDE